ncbi:protein phosphatase 2C domain-containing protein [Synechococcus sp. PCC 6312]|uniref:protein phosphatase 2C domain-containing protein n=1 Tax=Synechococcus sp. (strain ATCC 27167 / PCC 6312) TaxID=195253 RepID=UPI00029EFCEA|nr:PP2C family serine/threonine-protein phosphatase [Synechococcus sp. PCC 6312]AFY60763.1 serine/threonine protein phosphatase [Synechococcus sp. PCC 6312]
MSQPQSQGVSGPLSLATLYCPTCNRENLEAFAHCHACQTPLPKRYLRVIWPDDRAPLEPGSYLAGRFLVRGPDLVLDTQPGDPPPYTDSHLALIEPYLKLFAWRLHIPQVFGLLTQPEPVLLLELGPWGKVDITADLPILQLPQTLTGLTSAVPLRQAWTKAGLFRQLNWLWQLGQLWPVLTQAGVSATLFEPEYLRVEGAILRLVQLTLNPSSETAPELGQLLQAWSEWFPVQAVATQARWTTLRENLPQAADLASTYFQTQIQAWITEVAEDYTFTFDLATQTDKGPRRKRNEDNCYPPSETFLVAESEVLTLVCDGVGGHAGGDVASGLGIQAFTAALPELRHTLISGGDIQTTLETVIHRANDLIAVQNDAEERQDRQRMGTTLVAALAQQAQLYLAHVGDSRAYWITRYGCYQVTLDDDVASREVRLGLSPYRVALNHPYAGSLIQALGVAPSAHLRPTISPLIVDEDSLLLLCSDGLSDLDRVEQYWPTLLLPLLTDANSPTDLRQACQALVELANSRNGHDNVTVALIRFRVQPPEHTPPEPNYVQIFYPSPEELGSDVLLLEENFEPEQILPDSLPPAPENLRLSWLRVAVMVLVITMLAVGGWAWYQGYWLFSPHQSDPSSPPTTNSGY